MAPSRSRKRPIVCGRIASSSYEPERRHHFLQLAWPVNRAQYARLDRFVHDDAGLLARGFASVLIGLVYILSLLLNGHLELLEKLDRRHPQRLQAGNSVDECGWLRDRFGVKLFVNIVLGTYHLDAFDVARTRTEAEPVQDVKRAFFRRHIARFQHGRPIRLFNYR